MSYMQVMELIRAGIASGRYPIGEKLPPTAVLMDELDVKKGVLQRAIRQLHSEGVVVARQGSGVIPVAQFERIPRRMPYRLLRSHWGAGRAIQDHDTGARGRELDPPTQTGIEAAPQWATKALGLPDGTEAVYRRRLFLVDKRPVQLSTSYLPREIAEGTQLTHTDVGPGGTYNLLLGMGLGPTRFRESLLGRAPTLDEAKQLRMPVRGDTVLEITRVAWHEDRAVEVNRMVLDAKVYELSYEMSTDDPPWLSG